MTQTSPVSETLADLISTVKSCDSYSNPESGLAAKVAAYEAFAFAQCQQQWQPIETAPKDGTKFDAWLTFKRSNSQSYRRTDVWWTDREDGNNHWTWDGQWNGRLSPDIELTHWIPRPAPPDTSTDRRVHPKNCACDRCQGRPLRRALSDSSPIGEKPDAQTQQHLGQDHVNRGMSGKAGERTSYLPDVPADFPIRSCGRRGGNCQCTCVDECLYSNQDQKGSK